MIMRYNEICTCIIIVSTVLWRTYYPLTFFSMLADKVHLLKSLDFLLFEFTEFRSIQLDCLVRCKVSLFLRLALVG
uniref:Uncharacterized protein n=1 Tax=Amphimedon queenslandica TaxID=400682 RepID=A0A1X7VJ98_AMPQE